MYIIGLTGGIASGKSTASAYLRELGAAVWDADEVARKVVEPGKPGWKAIKREFGDEYFDRDGNLLRDKLGKTVFADAELRGKLNALLHPAILDDMHRWMEKCRKDGVVLAVVDAPLLFETGIDQHVDEVWTVSCGVDEQLQRLRRRGMSLEDAQKRLAAQMSDAERRSRSRRVIYTDCDVEDTRRQLKALYEEAQDGEL